MTRAECRESYARSQLLGFEIQIADDLTPARVLLPEKRAVLLRRVRHDLESHFEKLIAHRGLRDDLQDLAVESVHELRRGSRRRENAEPRQHLETGKARFIQRREFGGHGRTLETRHRDATQFSRARM